jgi:hypothetical protein
MNCEECFHLSSVGLVFKEGKDYGLKGGQPLAFHPD